MISKEDEAVMKQMQRAGIAAKLLQDANVIIEDAKAIRTITNASVLIYKAQGIKHFVIKSGTEDIKIKEIEGA